MTRYEYEASGCHVYEVDPTAKPGTPRNLVALTGEDNSLRIPNQIEMAVRIADALNGHEELLALLRGARPVVSNAAFDGNAAPWQREFRVKLLGEIDSAIAKTTAKGESG